MTLFTLERAAGPWQVVAPAEKLAVRGRLPGAHGYDLATHAFRVARAHGVPPSELLAPAYPGSWMVNARATSPVFQRWTTAPLRDAWAALVTLLEGGADGWLSRTEDERATVTRLVATVCVDGHGVAAVSKVLAQVCPETVPLMDDAALWLALDAVPLPTGPDAPTAGARWFVPMLDWFARTVLTHEAALVDMARGHTLAVLDAAQVLDRVLWFDSWGWRLPYGPTAPRWQWVTHQGVQAVVRATGTEPPAPGRVPVTWPADHAAPWDPQDEGTG